MALSSTMKAPYPPQREAYVRRLVATSSPWSAIATRDIESMTEPSRVVRIRSGRRRDQSNLGDPLRVLRWGVLVFLAGLNLAVGAALLNAGLAFLLAYCSTGAFLLSLLGYWRQTGRAIIAPGTLLILIAFSFVLATTSGVAAFAA